MAESPPDGPSVPEHRYFVIMTEFSRKSLSSLGKTPDLSYAYSTHHVSLSMPIIFVSLCEMCFTIGSRQYIVSLHFPFFPFERLWKRRHRSVSATRHSPPKRALPHRFLSPRLAYSLHKASTMVDFLHTALSIFHGVIPYQCRECTASVRQ